MSVRHTHTDTETIETEPPVQPETVLNEIRQLASSPADIIQKYITLAVFLLFGVFVWLTFNSNAEQPEKLYALMERQIDQTREGLKVQTDVLRELQQFSMRVPLEHQAHGTQLTLIDGAVTRIEGSVNKIERDNCELRDAVKELTQAFTRWIEIMEPKATAGSNP